jgi:uncharacterized repeat protein (TIGR01451 family)
VAGVDLTLSKTNNLTSAVPGDALDYMLTYGNAGSAAATNVVITETLPVGTTFIPGDNLGWTQIGATNQYTYTIANLDPLGTGTVHFIVHVNAVAPAGLNNLSNQASIADDGTHGIDITPTDNATTDIDTLNAAPDLAVTITGDPGTAVRGGGVIYTVHYSNVGNQDATDIVITQTLPENTTFDFLHSNPNWAYVGANTWELHVSNLAGGGGSGDADFAVKVNTSIPATSKQLTTTSSITDDLANGTDPNTANNAATLSTAIYQGIYVVAPGVALPRKSPPPVIRIFDIATGAETDIIAYEPTYKNSIRVATGDINGDGYDDIITSTITGTGRVRVYDGKTGTRLEGAFSEIAAFPEKGARGAYVASGDVNGDGRDDIIVGSGYRAKDAIVRVFSGIDGSLISTTTPFGTKFHGGVRVASGDVNGDGVADIVAAQGFGGNEVKVTKGISGVVLHDIKVGGNHYRGGLFVATAADLNADGLADLVIGRDRGATVLETYSGATGLLLNTITPFGTRYKLGVRVAAADINLDGVADIIAASGGRNNSAVKVFDGVTNAEIPSLGFQAYPAFPSGALFVAGTTPVPAVKQPQQQET